MKELSIEEKAIAYDKAVERLRAAFYDDNNRMCEEYCSACKRIIEPIFPELKEESEDEKIRKGLIAIITDFESLYLQENYALSKEDALAWLEKQGQTFTKKDVDDAYLKGVCDTKHELEKQGEQKPAWSEEDKRKIDRIYSILRQAADTHAFSISCRLIGDKECIELQDFLKSLRPQNRWKPSEEQIHYLSWIANIKLGDSVVEQEVSKHLNELLEDLKKLMKE